MHAQQADHWMRMYVVGGVHNAQKKKLKDKNSDQLKTLFVNQLIYLICIEKLHLISFLQNVHECWMEKDSIHLVKCIWAFKNPLKIRNCIQKIIITTAHLITIFDTSLSKFAFYINLINQLCSFCQTLSILSSCGWKIQNIYQWWVFRHSKETFSILLVNK